MKGKSEQTRNITITNPEIITMLAEYRKKLGDETGFAVNNTQALTRLLKEALK